MNISLESKLTKLFDANTLKAAYHAHRIDEGGPLVFRDEHFDKVLENMRKQQDAEQDEIDARLNEEANRYTE